ncbi:MAG: carbohydrate kinase [Ferruginibacter sp.]
MNTANITPPVVCFGETLWDLLPEGKLPGGAPMNVAYHLTRLGKNPAIISRIGNDTLGKELMDVFKSRNIDTRHFQFDNQYPTGKVFATIKEDNEVQYEIVRPVAWDFIQWDDRFESLIKEAEYFVFGSLITRNKISKSTLFKCLESANTKVLDINMRPPHFNKKIVGELLRKADILKLNLAELHLITGWFNEYNSDEDRMKLLKEKFDIATIIVTKGGDGAILNVDDGFYHHDGFTVTVADTVGSGDSFLAAILTKFLDGCNPIDTLGFACGVGALIASYHGGCPDYRPEEIDRLMNTVPLSHSH